MSKVTCGVDFGTSNSAIAVSKENGSAQLIKLEQGLTMPSTIFYHAKDNSALYGTSAINAYIGGDPGRFMRSIKRVLGSSLMKTGTRVNHRPMRFTNILSQFVGNMKNLAEIEAGCSIEDVVMGRPVHFRDNDPEGDRQAEEQLRQVAQMVGFRNIEFQYEPIAAAFAHEQKIKEEKLALVVDVGGGTSDFTVIKLSKENLLKLDRSGDILANSGVRVGGNDFDKRLSMKTFMPELGMGTTYGEKKLDVPRLYYSELSEWSTVNSVYTYKTINRMKGYLAQSHSKEKYARVLNLVEQEVGHTLLAKVEEAKINLTANERDVSVLDFLKGVPEVISTKADFEDSISDEINKISMNIQECLSQSGVNQEDIELVVLTGGSTEVPIVQEIVKITFPNAEISQENKLSSVGLGLAFDAKRKFSSLSDSAKTTIKKSSDLNL